MTEYNPFRAAFNDLECKDLVALRDATEGWYVEYKEELPIAKKIAKSISSFANSYGGWLFYGIEENRQLFTAGEFIGLSTATLDESLRRVRSAIAT
ncbi:MAG TPA: ATP-binding protein [Rhodospirillales bacterium]|nr:ATP-binding protein [Rhodospirillales bacterium]